MLWLCHYSVFRSFSLSLSTAVQPLQLDFDASYPADNSQTGDCPPLCLTSSDSSPLASCHSNVSVSLSLSLSFCLCSCNIALLRDSFVHVIISALTRKKWCKCHKYAYSRPCSDQQQKIACVATGTGERTKYEPGNMEVFFGWQLILLLCSRILKTCSSKLSLHCVQTKCYKEFQQIFPEIYCCRSNLSH